MPLGKKTAAEVRDTTRRRVEKLHADEKWNREVRGSKYRRSERAAESKRRAARMRKRKRKGITPTVRQLFRRT